MLCPAGRTALYEHNLVVEGCILRRSSLTALIVVLVALVCLLGLAACKSQSNPIVGKWAVSMGGQQPGSGGPTWQFTQDGKLIQSGGGMQNTTGTYTLSGNTLTLTTTVNGSPSASPLTLQWVSNDQFKIMMGSTPLTLTRQQ